MNGKTKAGTRNNGNNHALLTARQEVSNQGPSLVCMTKVLERPDRGMDYTKMDTSSVFETAISIRIARRPWSTVR